MPPVLIHVVIGATPAIFETKLCKEVTQHRAPASLDASSGFMAQIHLSSSMSPSGKCGRRNGKGRGAGPSGFFSRLVTDLTVRPQALSKKRSSAPSQIQKRTLRLEPPPSGAHTTWKSAAGERVRGRWAKDTRDWRTLSASIPSCRKTNAPHNYECAEEQSEGGAEGTIKPEEYIVWTLLSPPLPPECVPEFFNPDACLL
ncbi:hypothetical protein B0H16DRAFT_1473797 [Mycena metata]|uniref:Uncharacterized protein n=1 Tax=Mycena metata TaxID=1033252 RepID=A0AAD7HJS4_9AGAR|nr:hypothetical protein B0H16DRAFT_1473797 [Mycena metata]